MRVSGAITTRLVTLMSPKRVGSNREVMQALWSEVARSQGCLQQHFREQFLPKSGQEVLARRRPLTMTMMWKLHKQLGIPAESLIRPPKSASIAVSGFCVAVNRVAVEGQVSTVSV